MSDEFRKNLMGPEPTLLPAETEIYQHLALGQEAVDRSMESFQPRGRGRQDPSMQYDPKPINRNRTWNRPMLTL